MDSRAHPRLIVDTEIEARINGIKDYVFLYDLSQGGCMIETRVGVVDQGDWIELVLDDLINVRGQVIWQHQQCAGVRFERELHEGLVRYFGLIPSHLEFEQWVPRDRFGRELPPLKPL